jgi:xanthine dehydrogenase accessory factor
MKNIYQEILDRADGKSTLVLATVTATKGSTPQKPGSSAIFGQDGLIAGTVGGGYVERSVEGLIEEALKSGKSGHYHFDLDNEISVKDIGVCGGYISILVDAQPGNHMMAFEEMKKSIADRKAGILVTRIQKLAEDNISIKREWKERSLDELPSSPDQQEVFLEQVSPLPHLVIIGAGHIGKELCHLGSRLDFEVTMIDDRDDYANTDMLPEANEILVGDIGSLVSNLKKADDTYIIIVSRSHSEDARALEACVNSEAGYIGMIGSRRKIKLMRDKFLNENICSLERWDEVYTPIGIDIKAKTVEEIAVSIAAELIKVRAGKKSG